MEIRPQDTTQDSFMTAQGDGWLRIKGKDIWAPMLYISPDISETDILTIFEDSSEAPPTIPGYQWSTERVIEAVLSAAGIEQSKVPDKQEGDPWRAGEGVLIGFKRSYGDELYECLQAHITQSDWPPPATPALWKLVIKEEPDEPSAWKQPQGAHDAYRLNDKVTHKGAIWISTNDANTWEPGVYGWVVA